jgi:hypothetical protein
MTPASYDVQAIAMIGQGLLDCTLPKAAWTHSAHLIATVWLMRCRSDLTLEQDLPRIIRRYNEATGVLNSDTSGYHETITQASLQVLRHELAALPADVSVAIAVERVLTSRYADKIWLSMHWTPQRLLSTAARRSWMAPDLAPLPGAPRLPGSRQGGAVRETDGSDLKDRHRLPDLHGISREGAAE